MVAVADARVNEQVELPQIHDGKEGKGHNGGNRADHDKGSPLAKAAADLIRQRAEQGEHEYRKHVINGHDHARRRLRESKMIGEDQGHDGVIRLPEREDQEKRHAHRDGALVVELHKMVLSE